MELPGFYFNKEKGKYFPITQQYLNSQKVSKQKVERDTKLNEVRQSRINKYNKNKVIYGDILNRVFHFDELKKRVDSNLYHCINDNQMLNANQNHINPLAKAKVNLPGSIHDLEVNTKLTVLKHNNHQLEYYTLDFKRRCYHHNHVIKNGKFKRQDGIDRGVELCGDLNEDDKNHPLGCDNASVYRAEDSVFFYYGFEPLGSEVDQPKFYRFVKSTGTFPHERSYKVDIPVPEKESIRSIALSSNYVAVAYNDELFLHHWEGSKKPVFHHNFNIKSHKRRKGTRKPSTSSDIISITFINEGDGELSKSKDHLLVGFRNATLLAIPIKKNFIDFDRRFYVPLPSSVKSIVSLHEGSNGGLLISAVSIKSDDSQLIFYIEKLSYKNLKRLNIVRLNTKYSSVTSGKEICVLTENKKFLCYGKIGELDDQDSKSSGFDIFLLNSLENKAKNNTDEIPEIYPVRTMDDYVKEDIKDKASKLISLNSIENVQVPFSDNNPKNHDVELEYEVERFEPSLSNGSRIAMVFQTEPAVELGALDEKYMVISANLA